MTHLKVKDSAVQGYQIVWIKNHGKISHLFEFPLFFVYLQSKCQKLYAKHHRNSQSLTFLHPKLPQEAEKGRNYIISKQI